MLVGCFPSRGSVRICEEDKKGAGVQSGGRLAGSTSLSLSLSLFFAKIIDQEGCSRRAPSCALSQGWLDAKSSLTRFGGVEFQYVREKVFLITLASSSCGFGFHVSSAAAAVVNTTSCRQPSTAPAYPAVLPRRRLLPASSSFANTTRVACQTRKPVRIRVYERTKRTRSNVSVVVV
jgi:hypothetical protein